MRENIDQNNLCPVEDRIPFNTLQLQQKDQHFEDNISKGIFLRDNLCILIQIS